MPISGDRELDALLSEMERRVQNARDIMAGPVDQEISKHWMKLFETEGASGGTPWAPHEPLTTRLRARPGHGFGGIGRDRNRLWSSLIRSSGPDSVKEVTNKSIVRGTTVPYAEAFHAGIRNLMVFGRQTGRSTVGRPLVTDTLPRDLVSRIADAIGKAVGK